MWFWEVLWEDYQGKVNVFYSLRGYRKVEVARQILMALLPKITNELHKKGGNMITAQLIYSTCTKLYDNPDQIL